MNKRSTAFPVLYIAVVALVVIVGIIYNDSVNATVMERYGEAAPAGGLIFELLYGAILMIPAYFLLQHKILGFLLIFIGMPLVTLSAVCICSTVLVLPLALAFGYL